MLSIITSLERPEGLVYSVYHVIVLVSMTISNLMWCMLNVYRQTMDNTFG